LNFTLFFDDDLTAAAQTALCASNLDLDESFGFAAQFGIDFEMSNDRPFNFDPLVLGIGLGKTF
jgi:outer membrane protein W